MHSTVTSLLEVLNDVLSALVQKGFVVVLAMFDSSAAFDTIKHAFLPHVYVECIEFMIKRLPRIYIICLID